MIDELLARHASGDWGDVTRSVARANDYALEHGERLFSAYETPQGRVLDHHRGRPLLNLRAAAERVLMRCSGCSTEAIVLKTVICRGDRDRRGVLCDPCWLPLRDRLWIVPGPVACFGRCRSCSGWFSVRELGDLKPGAGHGSWFGTCRMCMV